MKKTLVVLLVAGIVSLAGVFSARAQSTDPALVKVPFRFIVGGKLLPAGSYRISAQTQDAAILLISSFEQKSVAAFASTRAVANPSSTGGAVHVAFKNYDGQYFLAMVSMPGEDSREVVLSKTLAEQMLAKLNLTPADRADTAAK
jgi:hypothetical protein